jgi:hypothetical protein
MAEQTHISSPTTTQPNPTRTRDGLHLRTHHALFILVPVIWAGWWLGAHGLQIDGLWIDEWWTVYRAGGGRYGPLTPWGVVERMLSRDPNQSIGYFLILSLWTKLVGWSDFAARSLSLLIGVLAVPLAYATATRVRGVQAGIVAALLMATSNFFVYYLHELRAYALQLTFATLAIWAYTRALDEARISRGTAAGLAIGVAGILYTHYVGALLILGVGLYHLVMRPKRGTWWAVTGYAVLGMVLFTPWAAVMAHAVENAITEGGRPDMTISLAKIIRDMPYIFSNGLWPLWIPVLAGAVLAVRQPTGDRARRAVLMAGFVSLTAFAGALLMQISLDVISHIRYLLALWAPLTLFVALSLERLLHAGSGTWRVVGAVTAAAWVGAGFVTGLNSNFHDTFHSALYAEIFRPGMKTNELGLYVRHHATSNDAVVFSAVRDEWALKGPLEHYMHGMPARYTMLNELDDGERSQGGFIGGAARVWVGYETGGTPTEALMSFQRRLDERDYLLCETPLQTPNLQLDMYAVSEMCCTPPDEPTLRYDLPLTLTQASLSPVPGWSFAEVLISWEAEPGWFASAYSVSVYATDADGQLVAQTDYPVSGAPFDCHPALLDFNEAAPGDYAVHVVVYAWETGERVGATATATGEAVTAFSIGIVTVDTDGIVVKSLSGTGG